MYCVQKKKKRPKKKKAEIPKATKTGQSTLSHRHWQKRVNSMNGSFVSMSNFGGKNPVQKKVQQHGLFATD